MGERERILERRRPAASLARHQARRAFALTVAVGGTLGGLLLLGANVSVALLAGALPTSPVPLLANAALVFGGVMFAREFRRSGPMPRIPGERRSVADGGEREAAGQPSVISGEGPWR